MEMFFIATSLIIVVTGYIAVSLRERSFLNVLTPSFAVFIPANYFADIYLVLMSGPTASTYAYFLNYLAYAAFFGLTAIGYMLAVPAFKLPLASTRRIRGSRLMAYLFLALAIALYWPVLSRFRGDILNPRVIYEQTRTGYGVNFFLSTTLCYFGLALFLFQKSSRLEFIAFITVCLLFVWMHGSKGHMLGILFILAMYYVYVAKRRVSFMGIAATAGGLILAVLLMFLLTNPGIILNNGVVNLVRYSEYTANSMIVIDSNLGPLYGQLTLEQQIYSRLPRLLDPGKPSDYGEFYLAKRFFPAAYERGTGAPAFGFGTLFADFGPVAPLLLGVFGFINGLTMKSFVNSLRRFEGPGEFILLLFAAGIPLVPMVNVFLIPETLGLAIAANLVQRVRLLSSRRGGTGLPIAR
jgi:hypothetical protein